jgi:hypothetical protein
MSARPGMAQNQRYVEVEQEIHRIVHAADGDTDELIDDLTVWVFDHLDTQYRRCDDECLGPHYHPAEDGART